jgi:hypothetical protein
MHETGEVGPVRRPERDERTPMQLEPVVRRQALLDDDTCDLVAKRDGVVRGDEHSGAQAFVKTVRVSVDKRLQQVELGARRHDGDGVE